MDEHTLLNDIVLVGADPRAWNYATLQWGANVEKALFGMGSATSFAVRKQASRDEDDPDYRCSRK